MILFLFGFWGRLSRADKSLDKPQRINNLISKNQKNKTHKNNDKI